MKIILALSVALNIFLGVMYFQEKNKPPLERIVVEHKPKIIRETVTVTETPKPAPKASRPQKDGEKIDFDPLIVTDAQDYNDVIEQMETSKREYLLNQLNVPEETLKKHDKLREEYFLTTGKIYQKAPHSGEMTIAEKRELLRLEENYQKQVQKLYGKSNWEKLENYRHQYNESVMKKVREENAPAILMSP